MKKCTQCGAVQNDNRTTCLDCGAMLGRPMSAEEEKLHETALSTKLSGMSERTEDFYVLPKERFLGIFAVVGLIALIVLWNIMGAELKEVNKEIANSPEWGESKIHASYAVNVFSSSSQRTPLDIALTRQDSLNNAMLYALIGGFCYFFSAPLFLFPRVMWILDTLRYRLWFNAAPEPSDYALIVNKLLKYSLFIVGSICLAAVLFHIFI